MKRAKPNRPKECPYVGKGGLKLQFALEHFEMDVTGITAADLGCHMGGFTDCLLQHGAAKVYCVDTAYGTLAWKLRIDERVVVQERTNALYWVAPEQVDFVVVDLGWTKQVKALPVVAKTLKPGGWALSLVKLSYEAPREWLTRGVLPEERVPEVLEMVHGVIPEEFEVLGEVRSAYLGSGGNIEYWLYLERK